jgi:probable phosphoglycerate mutase
VNARCERVIAQALALAGDGGRVALFAHGHVLRCLAGCWLELGVEGGALLVLGTATVSVLGFERQRRALLRWNAPVPAWGGDAPGSDAPWA